MQQSHVIPEIFRALAPGVKMLRRRISLDGAIGAASLTVGGFHSQADHLPTLSFDFDAFERRHFATQNSLDGARGFLVYEAPHFLNGTFSQRCSNMAQSPRRELPFEMSRQFSQRLRFDVGVARGSKVRRCVPQYPGDPAEFLFRDPSTDQAQNGAHFLDVLARAMNCFRAVGVFQATKSVLNAFTAQTLYRLRYRFSSFETIGHGSSPFQLVNSLSLVAEERWVVVSQIHQETSPAGFVGQGNLYGFLPKW